VVSIATQVGQMTGVKYSTRRDLETMVSSITNWLNLKPIAT